MFRAPYLLGLTALAALLSGGCASTLSYFRTPETSVALHAPSQTEKAKDEQPPADKKPAKSDSSSPNVSKKPPLNDEQNTTTKPPKDKDLAQSAEIKRLLNDIDPRYRNQLQNQFDALLEFQQRKMQSDSVKKGEATSTPVSSTKKRTVKKNLRRNNPPPKPKNSFRFSDQPDEQSPQKNDTTVNRKEDPPADTDPSEADEPSTLGRVIGATYTVPVDEELQDWKVELGETIKAIQSQLNNWRMDTDERARLETYLRLLYVAAERREDAVKPIAELKENEREFWQQQLFGLTETLNTSGTPLADRRATLALRHLQKAADHLSETSSLDVKNLVFCNKIQSFGRYDAFPKNEFLPNQQVLLYVQVENFAAEEQSRGFETVLKGSYQIYDPAGRRIADDSYPVIRDICRHRRHDFFISYRTYLPKTIPPGNYTLKITLEDEKAKKFGQSSIDFTIKRSGRNRS